MVYLARLTKSISVRVPAYVVYNHIKSSDAKLRALIRDIAPDLPQEVVLQDFPNKRYVVQVTASGKTTTLSVDLNTLDSNNTEIIITTEVGGVLLSKTMARLGVVQLLGMIMALEYGYLAGIQRAMPYQKPSYQPPSTPQVPPISQESSVVRAAKQLGIDTTGKSEEELRREIARRMI